MKRFLSVIIGLVIMLAIGGCATLNNGVKDYFYVGKIALVETEPEGYQQYQAAPDSTFYTYEIFGVYMELENWTIKNDQIHIAVYAMIELDGKFLAEVPIIDYEGPVVDPYSTFVISYGGDEAVPGHYVMTIFTMDVYSETIDTKTLEFDIVMGYNS